MTHDVLTRHAEPSLDRRGFVRAAGAMTLLAGVEPLAPLYSRGGQTIAAPLSPAAARGPAEIDLLIAETPLEIGGRRAVATTLNGNIPGPLVRLKEGEETIMRVTNHLREDTSIHWHGLLVPPEMDGVPGVSFVGIRPQETFVYRFPVKQYGTYWYHSHSGVQEQTGIYGPIIIDPAEPDPYTYDREYVVMLSDWTFEDPRQVLDNLKKQGNYYNYQRRTVGDFLRDASRNGLVATIRERLEWGRMRMDPTDIMDVTGATYTYLMNGLSPSSNWTALFRPDERIRLRFINAGAASTFDVRIPDLEMTVVHVSGQNVQAVATDEFRIGIAETFDVIVTPRSDRAYTIFAEAADRSGYARGTLTPREGMTAPVPRSRLRPELNMMDMGMDHGDMAGMEGMGAMQATPGMEGMSGGGGGAAGGMPGMDHGAMGGAQAGGTIATGAQAMGAAPAAAGGMAGHDMAGMAMADPALLQGPESVRWAIAGAIRTTGLRAPGTLPNTLLHEPDVHAPDNAAIPVQVMSRLHEPGTGLGQDGWRVLVYTDLLAYERRPDFRAPDREIEIHLTGNMERFMWSIDGVPFDQAEPIHFEFGERIRLTMVNDTMMQHPMHLHGMWMELENGRGEMIPRVHTINVKPSERVSLLINADAAGSWAFHCHVLYHMEVGMFRVVHVSERGSAGMPR